MAKIKLAKALLRRKELQGKVDTVKEIKQADIYRIITTRRPAHEGVDDVIAKVPMLKLRDVTAEFDFYARQLREIDALIQQANWTTEIETDDNLMGDFIYKEDKEDN